MTIKNKIKIAGLVGLLSVLPAKEKIADIQEEKYNFNSKTYNKFEKIHQKFIQIGLLTKLNELLPNGYKTSEEIGMNLRILAGIYNGGMKLYKEEYEEEGKDYSKIKVSVSMGIYGQVEDPRSYEKVLEDADVNKDKIITKEEVRNLEKKAYKKYAKNRK
jgi:hypothetical protein